MIHIFLYIYIYIYMSLNEMLYCIRAAAPRHRAAKKLRGAVCSERHACAWWTSWWMSWCERHDERPLILGSIYYYFLIYIYIYMYKIYEIYKLYKIWFMGIIYIIKWKNDVSKGFHYRNCRTCSICLVVFFFISL